MIKYKEITDATMDNIFFTTLCFADGSYYKVVGVADDDTLSVRKSAFVSSKKTGALLPYDTGITVGECRKNGSTTWCKIDFLPDDTMFFVRDFPNSGGWVKKKYLQPASNIIYSSSMQYKKNQNIFRVVGVRSDDTLNVREHPRNSSKKVGHLKYNADVDEFLNVRVPCAKSSDTGDVYRKCREEKK